MGLLGDVSAWIDNKKRVIGRNARDPKGLLSSVEDDVREWNKVNKTSLDKQRSVIPEIKQEGWQEGVDNFKGLAGLLGAIRAWHGSPHKFDKFDISKIGSGEGAQAYGHGLYAAENPEVAQGYAERLAVDLRDEVNKFVRSIRGVDGYVSMPKQEINAKIAGDAFLGPIARDNQEFSDSVRKIAYGMKPDGTISQDAYRAYIQLDKNLPPASKHLYALNLRWPDAAREAADPLGPQHFLDWDKPYAKQNSSVKSAINDRLQELGYGKGSAGLRAYHIENGGFADPMGTTLQNMFGGSPSESSTFLNQRGIPGIRYLDGGSRGAGQGTHNYVLFDDNLIDILSRNGVPVK